MCSLCGDDVVDQARVIHPVRDERDQAVALYVDAAHEGASSLGEIGRELVAERRLFTHWRLDLPGLDLMEARMSRVKFAAPSRLRALVQSPPVSGPASASISAGGVREPHAWACARALARVRMARPGFVCDAAQCAAMQQDGRHSPTLRAASRPITRPVARARPRRGSVRRRCASRPRGPQPHLGSEHRRIAGDTAAPHLPRDT